MAVKFVILNLGMEQENRPASRTPLELYQELKRNALGEQFDPDKFLDDLSALDRTGAVRSTPSLQKTLAIAGQDPLLKNAVLVRLGESYLAGNKKALKNNHHLAEILGIKVSAPHPPKRDLKTKALLLTGAGLIGVASVVGSGSPAFLPPAKAKESATTSQTNSKEEPTPPATPTTKVILPETPIPPLSTKPPLPKETPTPKPTSTPEVKIVKKDLLREFIYSKVYPQIQKMREVRTQNDPEFLKRINPELNQDRINGVILGGREEDKLTDTILIFSYHIPSHSLHLQSIPRDLQSTHARNARINQAYGAGGFPLIKNIVEDATGLSMDLSLFANFDVLADLINITSGTLEIELDREIRDDAYPTSYYRTKKIYYPKGRQVLNGQQALEVARSRHGSSDYDRSERQQKILEAIFDKIFAEFNNPLNAVGTLRKLESFWRQKTAQGTLKPDFDIELFSIPDLIETLLKNPTLVLEQLREKGLKLAQRPTIYKSGVPARNLITSAGIPGAAITKIRGGDPYSSNPRERYWKPLRQATTTFLTQNTAVAEDLLEEVQITLPPKEQRILYPQELSYEEVARWIGKLRGTHESVISESLFTRELANLFGDQREKVFSEIAKAHAEALIEHLGNAPALIGLDPGHGGTDFGSSGVTAEGERLVEKNLTWKLVNMIAEEIYQQTGGLYTVVILRPEEPNDRDLDGDGTISALERIQPRKALLLETESKLKAPQDRGKDIVYLSVHLNGSADPNQKGTSVYWPNEVGEPNTSYSEGSKNLAQILQRKIVEHLKTVGFPVVDLGARMDPDKRQPLSNSEIKTGPYLALGSPKLDRVSRNIKERDNFPQK